MKRIKKYIKSSAIYIALTVIALELIGYTIFDSHYYWEMRYLFISQDAIVNKEVDIPGVAKKNLWTYAPNTKVRVAAAYSSLFESWLEYDCIFDTNEFGLIETKADLKNLDYLILGDSFTEGHGGCPWLRHQTIKNSSLKGLNIINGGLQGTGILSFEAILSHIEKKTKPRQVIIIAISNDFKRGQPTTWILDNDCAKKLACSNADYWHFVKHGTTSYDILSQAVARRENRTNILAKEAEYYSFTIRTASTILKSWAIKSSQPANYSANFEALIRIKEKYPKLKVIMIPQRDEVGMLGAKNLDSQLVQSKLDNLKIKHTACPLNSSDYMLIDGHPNKQGYEKIFQCLTKEILENER